MMGDVALARKACRVAIAGFGKVGHAIAALLLSRREHYRSAYDTDVRLVAVCGSRSGRLDAAGLESDRLHSLESGKSGEDFVVSSGADVVFEAGPSDFRTGGPGLGYIRSTLSAGRDAIVISKGALVRDGRELRQLARASGATLKISGATGAALPTIDLLQYNLKGCEVLQVDGILNATTNYLLDAMTVRGLDFATALQEAQTAGFAERNARDDIEGWDTACKILLLANFGLGADLSMSDVSVDGIQAIEKNQIDAWRTNGLVPKLVGNLTRVRDTIQASVGLRAFPRTDMFAHVSGSDKAIRIKTDTMGEMIVISGGSEPTATAAAALKDLEHILSMRLSRRQTWN